MPAAISGPTGIPPINATPITVPINRPATNTGCCPIKNTPRPASQATKIPIRTLAIILKQPAAPAPYRKPADSTPRQSKKIIPIFNPCFSTKGTNCTNAVCCISSNTVAEIVIELFWLITPRKISVTKNRETKLTFIGSRHPD